MNAFNTSEYTGLLHQARDKKSLEWAVYPREKLQADLASGGQLVKLLEGFFKA